MRKSLALSLVASAPLGALSLERVAVSSRCTCQPCDCNRQNYSLINKSTRSKASVPANAASSSSSSLASSNDPFLVGNRMSDSTLAEHWARIQSSSHDTSCEANELLEKRLLGLEEFHGDNDVQVEVSAVYATADDQQTTSPAAATEVVPPPPTYNPLALDNDRWILVASGGLLALSAVALSMYLSGGITVAAASAGSFVTSSSSAASPFDKFDWFLRGGGANYATGRISVGLLSLSNNLNIKPVATYLTKRAVPSALRVLKKMAIMEVWRRVWLVAFHQFTKGVKSVSKRTVHAYQKYTPYWIRRGMQSIFKSSVQKAVHGTVGQWAGIAVAGVNDFFSGMMSIQFESAVNEAAEAAIESALDAAAEAAAESVTEAASDCALETVVDAAVSKSL